MTQNILRKSSINEVTYLREAQDYIKDLLDHNPLDYEPSLKGFREILWTIDPSSVDNAFDMIRYLLTGVGFSELPQEGLLFHFRYFFSQQVSLHLMVEKKKHNYSIKTHLDREVHGKTVMNKLTSEVLNTIAFCLQKEYPRSLLYIKTLAGIDKVTKPTELPVQIEKLVPKDIQRIFHMARTSTSIIGAKYSLKRRKLIGKNQIEDIFYNVLHREFGLDIQNPIVIHHISRYLARYTPDLLRHIRRGYLQQLNKLLAPKPVPIVRKLLSRKEKRYFKPTSKHLELIQKFDEYLGDIDNSLEQMTEEPRIITPKVLNIVKGEAQMRKEFYHLITMSSYCLKFCKETAEKIIKTTSLARLSRTFVKRKLKTAFFHMVKGVESYYKDDYLQHLSNYLQNKFTSDYKVLRNKYHPHMAPRYIMKVLYANRFYVLTSVIFNILTVVVGCQFFSLSAFEKRYLFETRGELVFLLIIFVGLALYCYCKLCLGMKGILKSNDGSKV